MFNCNQLIIILYAFVTKNAFVENHSLGKSLESGFFFSGFVCGQRTIINVVSFYILKGKIKSP